MPWTSGTLGAVVPLLDDDTPTHKCPGRHCSPVRLDQCTLAQATHHYRNHVSDRRLLFDSGERWRIRRGTAALGDTPGSANRFRTADPARNAAAAAVRRRISSGYRVAGAGEVDGGDAGDRRNFDLHICRRDVDALHDTFHGHPCALDSVLVIRRIDFAYRSDCSAGNVTPRGCATPRRSPVGRRI